MQLIALEDFLCYFTISELQDKQLSNSLVGDGNIANDIAFINSNSIIDPLIAQFTINTDARNLFKLRWFDNDIKARVATSKANTLGRNGNMTSNSDVLCCSKIFSYFAATYKSYIVCYISVTLKTVCLGSGRSRFYMVIK